MERRAHRRLVAAIATLVVPAAVASAAASCGSAETAARATAPSGVRHPHPTFGATVTQASAPPPVSGGTLLVTHDGHTAVASDPDRDAVYVVDLVSTDVATIALQPGDEPGRLAEDAAGRVHVALRAGGALVTLDPVSKSILARRDVCVAPRGVAYDADGDAVYVACMSGELVVLPAAGGPPTRSVAIARDLRDVVVQGDHLLVSRFRAAEVLHVSKATWAVDADPDVPQVSDDGATPSVAWRMIAVPAAGGALMVHQRGVNTRPVHVTQGGYGGVVVEGDTCERSIVEGALTSFGTRYGVVSSAALSDGVLPVDIAVSPFDGTILVAAAGNGNTPELPSVLHYSSLGAHVFPPIVDGGVGPEPVAPPPPTPPSGCVVSDGIAQPKGQAIAVAFDGAGFPLVQTREPAALFLPAFGVTIPLSSVSRADTGHDVFHANSGGHIACASCHAEGGDDGRTWTFDGVGARRTPSLRGTVAGTAPYHWAGEMKDFAALVHDVYTGRMAGAVLDGDQQGALAGWVGTIPAPPAPPPADPASAARGKLLFQGKAGCSACHNGAKLTDNATVDVGTGGSFQVPPLVGVAYRAPFLHMGCASTLRERFDCGGAHHGTAGGLEESELQDLVSYLGTL